MNILFVAGPGRSGTTAFANYLNQHPRVLICKERYKFLQPRITPELFTFDRILDYREGETNLPREHHEKLLSGKDPQNLKWIGDKTPSYVRNMSKLHRNNPGSRFIVLYRPIEEVAESYDARSKNPKDAWLGGKNGFEIGVRDWNIAMKKTRQFVEGPRQPEVLIISYHDFFSRSEACIPLVSRFLEIEFEEGVRRSWERMSRSFEDGRRQKESLSEEQARYIQENKDHEAEAWVLDRIERQWEDPGLPLGGSASGARPEEQGGPDEGVDPSAARQLEHRVLDLEQGLKKEQQKSQRLEARVRGLESRTRASGGSPVSRLLKRLGRLRRRLLDS